MDQTEQLPTESERLPRAGRRSSLAQSRPLPRLGRQADALDKVGLLAHLSHGVHATTEQVAHFYEVPIQSVSALLRHHRRELGAAGLLELRGEELRSFQRRYRHELPPLSLRASRLTVWSRGAIMAAGQLLADSPVAERLRRYLLAAESASRTGRFDAARLARFQERDDYRGVLHSLKLGGAVSEHYRLVQNTLYIGLFGMTAAMIRTTREQVDGDRRADGAFTAASARIAKNYLSRDELRTLDAAVATVNAQLEIKHPHGATIEQMLDVVHNAVSLFRSAAASAA